MNTDLAKSSNLGLSANDLKLMANAVYGESRGEPYVGQVAVAAVILNRVKSPSFPNTVSGVIFQPGAFTAVADGQIWLTPNENAKKAVQDAIEWLGSDRRLHLLLQSGNGDFQMDLDPAAGEDDRKTYFLYVDARKKQPAYARGLLLPFPIGRME